MVNQVSKDEEITGVSFGHGVVIKYHKDLEDFDTFAYWLELICHAGNELISDIIEAGTNDQHALAGEWVAYFRPYDKSYILDYNWLEIRKGRMCLQWGRERNGSEWGKPVLNCGYIKEPQE